jgi:hypothetical protein
MTGEKIMSTGTSVLGTWEQIYIDWGAVGTVLAAGPQTFHADGTWTYAFGGGRWFQVEGMVTWSFDRRTDLIYSGNAIAEAVVGIQGFAVAPPDPESGVSGCFYMVRQEKSSGFAHATAEFDIRLGLGRSPNR